MPRDGNSEGSAKERNTKQNIGEIAMSSQIEITYTFNAPRELVVKAFTESQHLRNWWGPKGWAFM